MMSLTFGLFTQVSGSGPLGPLVFPQLCLFNKAMPQGTKLYQAHYLSMCCVCMHMYSFAGLIKLTPLPTSVALQSPTPL